MVVTNDKKKTFYCSETFLKNQYKYFKMREKYLALPSLSWLFSIYFKRHFWFLFYRRRKVCCRKLIFWRKISLSFSAMSLVTCAKEKFFACVKWWCWHSEFSLKLLSLLEIILLFSFRLFLYTKISVRGSHPVILIKELLTSKWWIKI